MIDLHSHVLPGLDDGCNSLAETLELLRLMAGQGVQVVAATPHVRRDFATTADTMEAALRRVRDAVAAEGLPIRVVGGAEIALEELDRLEPSELARLGLGGNPSLLLLEYPYYDRPTSLAVTCESLRARGITPVIAHPERNEMVQQRPADIGGIVTAGGLVQITAASLDGRFGRATADCSLRLLDLGLVHLAASDAHSPPSLGNGIGRLASALDDPALAHWLTSEVPAALLAGEQLPPRPRARSRGRRRFFARFRR